MASLSITAGGGEVKDLTAAPGSSCVCDVCGADNELTDWAGVDGNVYWYCKVCWFDVCDTIDELEALKNLPESEIAGCYDCGSPTAFTEEHTKDGRSVHLCENCNHSDDECEPDAKRPAFECDDCKQHPGTQVFYHLDGRRFHLCESCWQMADQSDDYGVSFGSNPRLRTNGPAFYCECPLPLDYVTPNHCELCKGVVVTLKDN